MKSGKLGQSGWNRPRLVAGILTCILAMGVISLQAQTTGWGTMTGRVTDSSGLPIAGANVRLRNDATNIEVTTATNTSGDYAFANVIPGTYEITFAANGFKIFQVTHMVMYVSQTLRQDATLRLEPPFGP